VTAAAAPRGGRGIAIFGLFLALVALAGAAISLWHQNMTAVQTDSVRADLAGEISGAQARSDTLGNDIQKLTRDLEQMRDRRGNLRSDVAQLERRVTDVETSLKRAEARETATQPPSDRQWVRKEIEHLLRIANQRLSLADDPETALAALLEADQLITAAADPGLQPARRQIADDILALRSADRPDIEGLALRLASLARRTSELRLSGQPQLLDEDGNPAPDTDSGFARLRRKIAEFLAGIFTVRRTAGEPEALLSPEQSFFLRRNLELELQSARLALLAGDTPVYQASVGAARRWTMQYFDPEDPGVKTFVETLRELENRKISADYPDISGSLRVFLETTQAPAAQ
jgi:uroporphyrin-3 C-methyltransferase